MLGSRGRKAGSFGWQHTVLALALGVLGGFSLGYLVMQTAETIFATGATKHHGSTGEPAVAVRAVKKAVPPRGDTIHSIMTSGGDGYQNFQGRIMYGTYKLIQKMPGGEKLTGFTRILHRTKSDEIMDEIPTFHAVPLDGKCDVWCDFPVAYRPHAVQQWMDAVDKDPSMLQGDWVLLLECDYVWMKPMQAPDANDPAAQGFQYHFDYIIPNHPDCNKIIKELCGGCDPATVPASGPAPVLMRFAELKAVTPAWERVTMAIEASPVAKKTLDWVREMYAWDIAVVQNNIAIRTQDALESPLIVQPPHDLSMGNASMCHYTWGATYNDAGGKELWKWEKRDYNSVEFGLKVPFIKMPPPFQDGMKLQDGYPVTRSLYDTVKGMLAQMNLAIDTLPDLTSKRIIT